MKTLLLSFIITGALLGGIISPEQTIMATASIDGAGHYRLSNYVVDSEGCLTFYDFLGQYNRYCQSYEITPIGEYHKKLISSKSFY